MSALTEFLYPAPAKRTVGSIVAWWESRRLAYNAIVGVAGVVGLGGSWILASLPPSAYPFSIPLLGVVGVGVIANLCYFLGPVTEIVITKVLGSDVLPTGPALYRMGLTFSVGLALLPVLVSMISWVARMVGALI